MITKGVNLKLDIENRICGSILLKNDFFSLIVHLASFEKTLTLNWMQCICFSWNSIHLLWNLFCVGIKKFLFLQKSHLVERFLFSIAFLSRQSFTERNTGLGLLSDEFSKPQRGHLWQKLKCLENISTTSHTWNKTDPLLLQNKWFMTFYFFFVHVPLLNVSWIRPKMALFLYLWLSLKPTAQLASFKTWQKCAKSMSDIPNV